MFGNDFDWSCGNKQTIWNEKKVHVIVIQLTKSFYIRRIVQLLETREAKKKKKTATPAAFNSTLGTNKSIFAAFNSFHFHVLTN